MRANDIATLSPSQLNRQVRVLLESHFDFVWVEGEISNFACPSSGHWYFTLKDADAQVRCAMFRNRNQRLRFRPENGDQVRLRARVSLYEGRGEFQLVGEFMEPAGAGALQARFEALRDKLRDEGLFDSGRKRPLPRYTSHLAVISSPSGAALQDVLQVLARRNPAIRVTVLPSAVQGEQAPAQLRAALARANRLAASRADCDFDAIILTRGGGSLEDLWAFNDEALAREIAASALPVVAGVGHEVDVTIADFAADVRAPTPSAAAELLSEDREELLAALAQAHSRMHGGAQRQLQRLGLQLAAAGARLRHPGDRLREQAQRLDEQEARLLEAVQRRLQGARQACAWLGQRLHSHSPGRLIVRQQAALERQRAQFDQLTRMQLAQQNGRLAGSRTLLESLNPLGILARGYAIISDEHGQIVRDAKAVAPQQLLSARLASGRLRLRAEAPEDDDSG